MGSSPSIIFFQLSPSQICLYLSLTFSLSSFYILYFINIYYYYSCLIEGERCMEGDDPMCYFFIISNIQFSFFLHFQPLFFSHLQPLPFYFFISDLYFSSSPTSNLHFFHLEPLS